MMCTHALEHGSETYGRFLMYATVSLLWSRVQASRTFSVMVLITDTQTHVRTQVGYAG